MGAVAAPARVIRFYRWTGEGPALAPGPRARDYVLSTWRPALDGPPRRGPRLAENLAWFAFDLFGLFASSAFEELTVRDGGRLLHRLIVTPRWRRFPFMADQDVQIGAIWTAPEARRLGLAVMTVREAHWRHAAPGRRFWWLADEANPASIALAEACGYRQVGRGRRTAPFGVRALGQFVMESAEPPPGRAGSA